jgi:hypothetical protein
MLPVDTLPPSKVGGVLKRIFPKELPLNFGKIGEEEEMSSQ